MKILEKGEILGNKKEVFRRFREGQIFIHPTDTIYGLGCDATNKKAVQRMRKIKNRKKKPFSVIAPSKEWILKNCLARKEDLEKLPGPYTLIVRLKNKKCVAKNTNPGLNTLGVRIPKHWFSRVTKEFGRPIITTSANLSGRKPMTSIDNLDEEIKKKIDFIIYEGPKKGGSSKKIDLTG